MPNLTVKTAKGNQVYQLLESLKGLYFKQRLYMISVLLQNELGLSERRSVSECINDILYFSSFW